MANFMILSYQSSRNMARMHFGRTFGGAGRDPRPGAGFGSCTFVRGNGETATVASSAAILRLNEYVSNSGS